MKVVKKDTIQSNNYYLNTKANFNSNNKAIIAILGKEEFNKIKRFISLVNKSANFDKTNNLKPFWTQEKIGNHINNNYDKSIVKQYLPKLNNLNTRINNLMKNINFTYKSGNYGTASHYIIKDNNLVRISNHWGNNIRSCEWQIDNSKYNECRQFNQMLIAMTSFDKMERKNV